MEIRPEFFESAAFDPDLGFARCFFGYRRVASCRERPVRRLSANVPAALSHAALARLCWMNASRSALIWSAFVVGIPCGKPGYTLSVAFFTSFAESKAAAPIGTI